MTGEKFGELTVIKLSDRRNQYNKVLWECRCVCGEIAYIPGPSLRAGHYKSCGCRRPEKRNNGVKVHIKSDSVDGTRKTALKAKLHKNNKAGRKGVIWLQSRGKWKAYIGFKGKQITLGYFEDKNEAIAARIKAEEIYHRPILEEDNGRSND